MATIAAAYDVAPLGDDVPFGATVSGLTLDALRDPAVRRSLYDLWIEKGVILFRGGESSPEMQMELSRCFGTPEAHLFKESHADTNPELVKVKYYPDDGSQYDVDGEVRGGFLSWHRDLIYTSRINHGGILRPVQLPASHGRTGFIDQIAAYDRLPQDIREQIEDLHVVYEVQISMAKQRFANKDGATKLHRLAKSGGSIESRRFTYPRVIHPMVYEQEQTGRKVLNVSPTFSLGIYEMGGPEGDALLDRVVEVLCQPALAYFHDWKMDDMVLWDNWRVMHSAEGVPAGQTRVMERTTIAGDYALGRPLGLDGPVVDFDV